MYSLNFLYYCLGIGFLMLVGFVCYALYYLAEDLKAIRIMLQNITDLTRNIDLVGNQIKLSTLNILKGLLGKGGEKLNGTKH